MEALYLKIRDEIKQQIDGGVYREGEVLPPEGVLAEKFDVSRPTVRRAIQMLIDEGRLERRPHRGTVVCPPKIEQSFTTMLRSFNDEMIQNGKDPHTRVITARRQIVPADIAGRMSLMAGSEVFRLVRLRYAGDEPNVIVASYIPLDVYPDIESVDFTNTSLYDYFRQCGKPVVHAHRILDIFKAGANLASVLDIEVGEPVYRFVTAASTEQGRVAEYTVATYRGRSNAFEFDVSLV